MFFSTLTENFDKNQCRFKRYPKQGSKIEQLANIGMAWLDEFLPKQFQRDRQNMLYTSQFNILTY